MQALLCVQLGYELLLWWQGWAGNDFFLTRTTVIYAKNLTPKMDMRDPPHSPWLWLFATLWLCYSLTPLIPPMVQSGSLTNLFPPMLQANPYSRLPKFFQPCLMVESMHSNYFIFCGIEYLNIRAYTSLAIDNNCYFESWGNGFASMALKIKAFWKKFLSIMCYFAIFMMKL